MSLLHFLRHHPMSNAKRLNTSGPGFCPRAWFFTKSMKERRLAARAVPPSAEQRLKCWQNRRARKCCPGGEFLNYELGDVLNIETEISCPTTHSRCTINRKLLRHLKQFRLSQCNIDLPGDARHSSPQVTHTPHKIGIGSRRTTQTGQQRQGRHESGSAKHPSTRSPPNNLPRATHCACNVGGNAWRRLPTNIPCSIGRAARGGRGAGCAGLCD